jgi:hypothetical protein
MKAKLICIGLLFAVVGCSSTPTTYKLSGYKGPESMERTEVVQSSKQCIYAKMRPNVEYLAVKTDAGGKVLVPVNVHCEPY